jgi:hypothetical protein
MRIKEAKISDIAVEAGEHLGLYDKENQTLKRTAVIKHLKDVHGLSHKRDISFVIDSMKTSFPEMKIKEDTITEAPDTIRLSSLIVMIKEAMKKRPKVKNYNKLKDLLPQLEDYLSDHGNKKIPHKELAQIMSIAEQTVDGGVGDHTNPEDVDENELLVGIEVEYEHAKGDRIAAIDIALDHLKEDPKYYTKLVKSGIVDEPKAIELAKKTLNVENMIREEIRTMLKEDPNLWDYIYNFGNTYIPKKQGE